MLVLKKNGFFHILCWISMLCSNFSSASRTKLLMSQFEKKLDVLQTEIELLKFDVLDTQDSVRNLNGTCYCDTTANSMQENSAEENKTTGSATATSRLSAQADTNDTMNRNSMAILAQCKIEVQAQVAEVSSQFIKAFNDEKKHARGQLKKMHEVMNKTQFQQKNFQTEADGRIKEQENKVKEELEVTKLATTKFLNNISEQTASKLEELQTDYEQKVTNMYSMLNATKEENSKTIGALEETIKMLETKIAKLEDKSTSVDKENQNIKKIIEVMSNFMFHETCFTGSENWVTNFQLKARFLYINTLKMWSEAVNYCKEHCAHLVELDTEDKSMFVQQIILNQTQRLDYWVGAHDTNKEGEWTWFTSGKLLSAGFSKWRPGEPNDAGGKGEDCMAVKTDVDSWRFTYGWNDQPCDVKSPFVCERKLLFV